MKNLLISTLFIVLIAIFILPQACSKDEDKDEKVTDQFTLLTDHIWTYDKIYTNCQDYEINWFINMIDSSAKGKTIMYNAEGKFVSPFENGSWKFNNGETEIITFDTDDPSDIYGHVRIDILTEEVLELTDLVDVPPTDTCSVKSRLVK